MALRYRVEGSGIGLDIDVSLGRQTWVLDANRGRSSLFEDEPMLLGSWSADVEDDDHRPIGKAPGLDSVR
jgi:hypothetical protein